jgi:SAM-dependent methyltransferase
MTDLANLARHRARATTKGMFLHAAAADEVQDRLEMVNKSFTKPAIVSGFPDFWAAKLDGALHAPTDEVLAIDQGAHDLVVHAMALHWANDPVGQLIQCRRALKADGLFLSVAFGGQTLNELRACLGQAEVAVTGGMSPRVAPMAELRDMGALLQRAGYALPVADAMPLRVEYDDAWHLMRDLRAMGETNALASRLRRPTARKVLEHAADLYRNHFGTDDGRITATFDLVFLTGWAPDDSQPKALRPGSAKQRLADALRTDETKLPN